MFIKGRKIATRVFVALATFTAGVAATVLWVASHYRSTDTPRPVEVSHTLKNEEVPLPDGWKELEVKERVVLWLPQDMKPAPLIGDSLNHREAYNNQDIYFAVVYGEPTPCDTPSFLLERSSYSESVVDINGRKAKLGIDGFYRPKFISARLCFLDADEHAMQLGAMAYCKDDSALKVVRRIFTSIKFKSNQ